MRICLSLIVTLSIMIVVGCGSVNVNHPIGEPLAEDNSETSELFDGTWTNDDGEAIQLKYLDGGKLRIASLDWDDESQTFTKNEWTVLLTTHRSASFFNFTDEEENDGKYQFVRYVFASKQTMIILTPRVEAFEKAVKDGKLKGRVKRGKHSTTVNVTSSKKQVDDFIDPSRLAEQFEVETPVVLKRLKS